MKRFLKASVLFAAMAMVLAGCNCFNKMAKNISDVKVTSTPEVLILKGSTVNADIKVEFPGKYFDKKAVVRVTPVLVFDDGEIVGTPKYLQGESVKDNYSVISKKQGGTFTQSISFPYDPRAAISTLEIRLEVSCNKGKGTSDNFFPLAAFAVARGVSDLQGLSDKGINTSIMADNFKRVTTIQQDADVMYQINSSTVRPAALNDQQIKMLEEFVRENKDKDRTTLGAIQAKGYASPDGPIDLNDKLSKARGNTGKDAISKNLKDVNPAYDVAAYGEDWDGFKALVEASNIPDKNLILQVLNMYSSPVQRDREIKNMSAVYDVLKKDILPQLRRTKLVASADVQGKTDAELREAVKSNISALSLEEMLFAATLYNDNATKGMIYKTAVDKYGDVRAYNNLGVVYLQDGNVAQAKQMFQKAASMSSSPQISNNLGVVALAENNIADAKKYLAPLNSLEAANNKAIIELYEGNYAAASRGLQGYNKAVAELANGNIAAAKSALGNAGSAKADYLRGVIAMREGDSAGALKNLKSAVSKDKSLAAQAKKDIEFVKLFGNNEFNNL